MRRVVLWIGILTAIIACLATYEAGAQETNNQKTNNKMQYQDIYPVFITKDLQATQAFYVKWFNLNVAFESGFFVLLISDGERPWSIGLLDENHPSSPPSAPAMNAEAGVFLTLQVADAKSEYERLKSAGLKIRYELHDEPWGQRRFGIVDPNGMYVDIVEQTEPEPGFWDKYPVKK